jgi:hypothetical protein
MLDRAQALDLDPDHVARLKELSWVKAHTDPARGPGEDQIAREQRAGLGDEVHQLLTTEDHVGGARVLAQLPVDPGAESQIAGVGDLLGGRDPGTEGTERIGALGARPLGLAELEVARRHVVGHAVAADLLIGADHDRELALVVEPPHHLGAADRSSWRSG